MIDPPRFLAFDPTGLCNLRCTTCVLDRAYPEPVLATWPVIEALEPVLGGLHALSIGCNAEPTLHPELLAIVRWLRARTTARTLLTTNATRLDPARAEALVDAGVDEVAVSADGATASTFESVRVRARYDEVLDHLAALARLSRSGRPALKIIFTTLRRNVAELPEVVALAGRLGVPVVSVNGYEPYDVGGLAERTWLLPTERPSGTQAHVRVAYAAAAREAARHGIVLKLPELVAHRAPSCPFEGPVVGPHGVVSPCSALSYAREVPLGGAAVRYERRVLGRLPDDSFAAIWERPDYVAFRTQARGGITDPACRSCLVVTGAICARQ